MAGKIHLQRFLYGDDLFIAPVRKDVPEDASFTLGYVHFCTRLYLAYPSDFAHFLYPGYPQVVAVMLLIRWETSGKAVENLYRWVYGGRMVAVHATWYHT